MVLAKVNARMGQFSMTVKLKGQNDDLEVVVISIYSPENVRRSAEL